VILPVLYFIISPLIGIFINEYGIKLYFFIGICAIDPVLLFLYWEAAKSFQSVKYVRLTFSDLKFEVYIQNRLYFRQNIDNLETIEIVKNKHDVDNDLIFIGTETKTIRLTCIMIHEKKTKEVLEFIKKWGEDLNIPVNLRKIKHFFTTQYQLDKKEIEEKFKISPDS